MVDLDLTTNLAKSEYAKATILYLGKVVGQGQVCPVQAKVMTVQQFPPPTTKNEMMCFLGMVGFYQSFCENFSSVVALLTDPFRANAKYI